jgi:hypothetical protein
LVEKVSRKVSPVESSTVCQSLSVQVVVLQPVMLAAVEPSGRISV